MNDIMMWTLGTFPLLAALVLVGVVGLVSAGRRGSAAEKPATHTVVIKTTSYASPAVTVRHGDTVMWIKIFFRTR